VSASSPGTVVAQLSVTGTYIVNFSTTAGVLNPSSGSVLTDSTGKATIELDAGSTKTAGSVTATATVDGATITGNSLAFQAIPGTVVAQGIQIGTCSGGTDAWDCTTAGSTFSSGNIYIATSPLSARGTTTLGVRIQDTNGTPVANVSVDFTSQCTNSGQASISQGVSDSTGKVSVTYQASAGCEGDDLITATEPSSGNTATATINVLPPIIGSIVFTDVQDSSGNSINTIYIQGSGGESTARVIFKVVDRFGDPVEGQTVSFSLTSQVGGVSLQTDTGLTDAKGEATAFVNSGYISTSVRVDASLEVDTNNDGVLDTTLSTQSQKLSINTGTADEDSMSLTATTLNVEGLRYDGTDTTLNIRLADAFNNPVPDGTTVQFRTNYGRIQPSCDTSGGDCSVTWNSQAPRGPLDPNTYVPDVTDGTCPMPIITDEPVTISGTTGATDYVADGVYRVEVATIGTAETVGVDYTVDADGISPDGIQCVSGSTLCQNGRGVKVETGGGTYIATISGGYVQTGLLPTVTKVSNYEFALTEGTDYTVNADGSGITCVSGSTWCTDGATLNVSYIRKYVDEDDSGDTTHNITHPGVATAPFYARTGVPCPAAYRASSTEHGGYLGGLGQVAGSRSVVLAFAQGEESFTDSNGNGQYDFGEPFVDLPEAWLDKNEDGVFDNGSRDFTNQECYGPEAPLSSNNPATLNKCYQEGGQEETFVDFNNNGSFDTGNGIYNGTLCPKSVSDRTTTCSGKTCTSSDRYCTRDLVNIRKSITLIDSDSFAFTAFRDSSTGEYIDAIDLTGSSPASGYFDSTSDVTTNDGRTVSAGSDFTIGTGDSQVPYGISQTAELTSGGRGVFAEISGVYGQVLAQGTSIAVTSDACDVSLANTDVPNTNGGYTSSSLTVLPPTTITQNQGPISILTTSPTTSTKDTGGITLTCIVKK